ncbi:hypothetical protein J6590_075897 [Homalodisca vitripennis]|nr:hypothetical protein J6590_075897 [Homalodisca vitripennis]
MKHIHTVINWVRLTSDDGPANTAYLPKPDEPDTVIFQAVTILVVTESNENSRGESRGVIILYEQRTELSWHCILPGFECHVCLTLDGNWFLVVACIILTKCCGDY